MRKAVHLPWPCVLLVLTLYSASCAKAQIDWPQLKLTQVSAGFNLPLHIVSARDGSGRLFIVEQAGKIRIIQSNTVLAQPFLNITNRVFAPPQTDSGLLSLAFPPNFGAKGYFYVSYTRTEDTACVISRFFVGTNQNVADSASEQVLLVTAHTIPLCGMLAFGPDGFLYAGIADELNDPSQPGAQSPGAFFGKILRLDVETTITNSYLVPTNNPFVGDTNYLPEIWALGVRNPWRFSFDRLTGDFYFGDVGQDTFEEVDFQAASSHGGQNYGWPYVEGATNIELPPGFDTNLLTFPVAGYPHDGDRSVATSITGGFVYRGTNSPRMQGLYLYGDFFSGAIWEALHSGTNTLTQKIIVPQHFISTFGEDEAGELYLADFITGKIFHIEDSGLACQPFLSPPGGVASTEMITVTSASPGASIHYTTNGAAPTENDPVVGSNGLVVVASGMTLKAQAFRVDLQPSAVTTGTYVLQASTPVFTPSQGPITNGTTLAMSSATPNATIRYTLDATDPTSASTAYFAPFSIESSNVVSAQAYRIGFSNSPVLRVYFSGAVALQNPALLSNGSIQFSWSSQSGFTYQTQVSHDLRTWNDIGAPQSGAGHILYYTFPPGGSTTFYRMRIY